MTVKSNKLVDELFAVGAHYGYSKSKRHPSIKNNIYTNKDGIDIIDLEKTAEAVEKVKKKIVNIIRKGGKVILVGNKAEIRDYIPEVTKDNRSVFYVNNRWIGGTLTNFEEIQKRIKKLALLIKDAETGAFSKYTKKEILKKEKEIEKLKKYYEGLLNLYDKPKLLIVVDSDEEKIAVQEANKNNIPVVSISNTDNDITDIKFPIVANDRSRQTIKKILDEIFSGLNFSKRDFSKKGKNEK